jgi:hypothetical protein
MNGGELITYIKEFLENVLDDRVGIENLIGQLYDLYVPIFTAQLATDETSAQEAQEQMMDIKNDAIDSIYNMIQMAYDSLIEQIDNDPEFEKNGIGIDEQSKLDVDLYVDKNLNTLKSKVDLYLVPLEDSAAQDALAELEAELGVDNDLQKPWEPVFKSIRVKIQDESWNINGNVTANLIKKGAKAIVVDEEMTTRRMTRSMTKGSLLYSIMRNDLNMSRQIVNLDIDPNEEEADPKFTPYIEKGVAMVPLRTVSDGFDASLRYKQQERKVTLLDEGQRMVVPFDSKVVYMNGVKKFIRHKTITRDGVLYVPARATFALIGAKTTWNSETKEITIERK